VRSMLIIEEDDLRIDSELLKQFEVDHKVYSVTSLSAGDRIIERYHVDMVTMVAKCHIKSDTKKFIKELHDRYEETIPILFLSESTNSELDELLDDYVWWRSITDLDNNEKICSMVGKLMKFANSFDVKKFTLKRKYDRYLYHVKNVSHVYRPTDKYVTVCTPNPSASIKAEETFFYRFRIELFFKDHDIEPHFKQANQSCFVNTAYVEIVRPGKMELVLRCGTVIKTSDNYIHNFIEKEGK